LDPSPHTKEDTMSMTATRIRELAAEQLLDELLAEEAEYLEAADRAHDQADAEALAQWETDGGSCGCCG
jgi:hypothetical protein